MAKAKTTRLIKRNTSDPHRMRADVIKLAWHTIKEYLNNESIDDTKKAQLSLHLALKDYDIQGKKDLQKLKGTQDVARNAFLVNALDKASKLNNRIDHKSVADIVINADNVITAENRGDDLPEDALDSLQYTLMPRLSGKHKGEWPKD